MAESDALIDYLDTRVVDATATAATVEQPDSPPLNNHVGVRHASALYAGGYAAARALVDAALADRREAWEVALAGSSVSYTRVGMGLLTFRASPEGEGWDVLGEQATRVSAVVSGTDDKGKDVVTGNVSWAVSPRSAD